MSSRENGGKGSFTSASHILDYLVPRCLGLLPLRYDSNTERFVPSQLWLVVCNVCGLLYIVTYPIAAIEINKYRTTDEEDSFDQMLIISKFVGWYALSVGILINQMWFSKHQMHLMNRCTRLYRQCRLLSEDKMDAGELVYSFILRSIYSYCGFAILNYMSLMHFFNDLSNVNLFYKILFFAPHIVITTNAISFHSKITSLTICGRCINRAICRCIQNVNEANDKPMEEFEQVCTLAMERFEYLTMFHAEWYEIARLLEKRLSLLMLLTVTNAFWVVTTTVNWMICDTEDAIARFMWFFNFVKLFFTYAYVLSDEEIQPNYVVIAVIRCSLNASDLAFSFLPSNKLKQEVS